MQYKNLVATFLPTYLIITSATAGTCLPIDNQTLADASLENSAVMTLKTLNIELSRLNRLVVQIVSNSNEP